MEMKTIMHLLFQNLSMGFRFLISVLAIFCSTTLMAQKDSVLVIFEITDKNVKEPIHNVNGTLDFGSYTKLYRSDAKGLIQFYTPLNITIKYSFTHPIYDSEFGAKTINLKSGGDTIKIFVELNPVRVQNEREIVVKAPGIPDTVFDSKRLSVADFEINRNGKMILLAYPKQLKKGSELLLFDGIDILNSFTVPGIAQELVRDYRGNAHVVCDNNVFGIHLSDQNIGIATIEKDYFFKYVAPIVDTNKTKMFFSNFSEDYPAFNYFSYDQIDSTYLKIIQIEDELMMELYRSEYKWVDVRTKLWAKNKELETGVDAEVWVGANYFTQSIYYKELYAPMFYRNDSIFVFDYYKDKLYTFDGVGNLIDSVAIYHHYQPKSTGWDRQLIQDKITGEIYAVYDRAGYTYLGLIDIKTGEIKEKVKLEFRYIDKIDIHNNFVYYVYRPFESNQKKYLYKERLPYKFTEQKLLSGYEESD